MTSGTPQTTPHEIPLSEVPPNNGETSQRKRRPIRGLLLASVAKHRGQPQAVFEWTEAYVSPVFPDGLPAEVLKEQPLDYQAAAALHWFLINFEPIMVAEGIRFSDGTQAFFSDGSPITFSSSVEDETTSSTKQDRFFGQFLADDYGARLTDDFGRGLVEDIIDDPRPADELMLEFGSFTDNDMLGQLGQELLAHSGHWRFIPLPDPLPIEREPGLQSTVDAAIVARDAQTLEDHLKGAPSTPAKPGQNYWPGAEMLDELRTLKREVQDLRELAATPPITTAPIETSVGQLAETRKKVGAWFVEAYVKALGTAAGTATVAASGALVASLWWRTLFHLLTTLQQSASAWLVSLVGG